MLYLKKIIYKIYLDFLIKKGCSVEKRARPISDLVYLFWKAETVSSSTYSLYR